jgi:TM2 domain-containing membrane protein YozV
MEQSKVDIYIATNAKHFESHLIPHIHDMLLKADDSKFIYLQSLGLKDPTTMLIVSLFGGHWGIDRFMIGDTGLGVAKLLTCGGLGIWTIADWFMVQGRVRELNFDKLQRALL